MNEELKAGIRQLFKARKLLFITAVLIIAQLGTIGYVVYRGLRSIVEPDEVRIARSMQRQFEENVAVLTVQSSHLAIIDLCQRRLAQIPNDPRTHLHLGIARYNTGKLRPAMFSLNKAVELDPTLQPAISEFIKTAEGHAEKTQTTGEEQ